LGRGLDSTSRDSFTLFLLLRLTLKPLSAGWHWIVLSCAVGNLLIAAADGGGGWEAACLWRSEPSSCNLLAIGRADPFPPYANGRVEWRADIGGPELAVGLALSPSVGLLSLG
jgi:hypothetical protein